VCIQVGGLCALLVVCGGITWLAWAAWRCTWPLLPPALRRWLWAPPSGAELSQTLQAAVAHLGRYIGTRRALQLLLQVGRATQPSDAYNITQPSDAYTITQPSDAYTITQPSDAYIMSFPSLTSCLPLPCPATATPFSPSALPFPGSRSSYVLLYVDSCFLRCPTALHDRSRMPATHAIPHHTTWPMTMPTSHHLAMPMPMTSHPLAHAHAHDVTFLGPSPCPRHTTWPMTMPMTSPTPQPRSDGKRLCASQLPNPNPSPRRSPNG